MSQISSMFGLPPGMGTVVETFEQAIAWGPYLRYYLPAYLDAGILDPTNTPTWELRRGLVLGKKIATGTWTNYAATNTDGSEVAAAILIESMRIQDVITGVNTARFYGIMVSGGVKAANLIGLDNMARAQMSNQFYFDDNFPGNQQFPFQRFQTKTANYQIVASDNLTHFDNLGATGAVTFTLPPIANGYFFGFTASVTNQNLIVASSEGTNMVTFNNISANSVAYQTGGSIAGGSFRIYSNPAGTKWFVEQIGSNTLTVA
jgi:hypothetical protein